MRTSGFPCQRDVSASDDWFVLRSRRAAKNLHCARCTGWTRWS